MQKHTSGVPSQIEPDAARTHFGLSQNQSAWIALHAYRHEKAHFASALSRRVRNSKGDPGGLALAVTKRRHEHPSFH